MPLYVSNIITDFDDNEGEFTAIGRVRKMLSADKFNIIDIAVSKRSLDARNKNRIKYVNTVKVSLADENEELKAAKKIKNARFRKQTKLNFKTGNEQGKIVVAGFGPAGMFAALTLAENGYKPLVVERGDCVENRVSQVNKFWETGVLNPSTNVQFGEGGAGTFSDGKLTTRISDPLCDEVLKQFHRFGAPDDIMIKAKPHIGTDNLRAVVKAIREHIISLGGTVMFNSTLENLVTKNGSLIGVRVNGNQIEASSLILATGHSARDTFTMLAKTGIALTAKPFSVGVRIEQRQSVIEKGLYGKYAGHPNLPKGEYQLSLRKNGKAVYTFCMCPGGTVVPAASETGMLVTNGMSEYSRSGDNANSALVVSVDSKDYGSGILDGMYYQQKLEKTAYDIGGQTYAAPAATVGAFLDSRAELKLKNVRPTYSLGVKKCDFSEIFNRDIIDMMKLGIADFNRKINGFATDDAVLTGVETRTSSPLRIARQEESLESVNLSGLYPCGEGAGYAGGIMSAAVDGIKVAAKIMEKYHP